MDSIVVEVSLEKDEARALTDEIKGDAEKLEEKLLKAYEGGAHIALGYSSWGEYFKNEFGQSERHGYELIDAGIVARAIESASATCRTEDTPNNRQALALAPLAKSNPDEAAQVWKEVVEEHGDQLTAADVKQAVTERSEYKAYLDKLPPLTREVLEQADESFDKHRNLLRNSNQLNHLANIANTKGDEVAAQVAQRALTEEGGNVFTEYDKYKEDDEENEEKDEIRSVVGINRVYAQYDVAWSNGETGRLRRAELLPYGFKPCNHCKGSGVQEKGRKK